jgi:predicted nucleotidyltransferase component of viral defense system
MFWKTVSPLLEEILIDLMAEELFNPFRLVGGTALSLQINHRMSVDIDLFTDAEYGSIDFKEIRDFLEDKYPYCSYRSIDNVAFGTYFDVGTSKDNFVKIDIYYTDDFVFDSIIEENIRMASLKEIIAMKLNVIVANGRKKDFWDLHYFLNKYSLSEMISFFEKRYPYNDNSETIKTKILDFEFANLDLDPECLLNKSWDDIKLDFLEKLQSINLS